MVVFIFMSSNTNKFTHKFLTSIQQIKRREWNTIVHAYYPFIQYEFLEALEVSASVGEGTGWQVNHLAIFDDQLLIAVVPLYIKSHSYGEYVFDFQWAEAFHQAGIHYYPKLVNTIPFTPCGGERVAIKSGCRESIDKYIANTIIAFSQKYQLSSFHQLFPENTEEEQYNNRKEQSFIHRLGMQFHWYNDHYDGFSDFLTKCKLKRRKMIKRERRKVSELGISTRVIEGEAISTELWQVFYTFYQSTNLLKSGHDGYLTEDFFSKIADTFTDKIMMIVAEKDNQVIATSLFFKGGDVLYGRYWGTSESIEFLHFEVCYYSAIEYCIDNKITRFDAGAQGIHKVQRGFMPIETHSYHWINHSQFHHAINEFVDKEKVYIKQEIEQLNARLPFR